MNGKTKHPYYPTVPEGTCTIFGGNGDEICSICVSKEDTADTLAKKINKELEKTNLDIRCDKENK